MNHTTSVEWGRAQSVNVFKLLSILALLTMTPLMVFYFFIAVTHFNGSLLEPFSLLYHGHITFKEYLTYLPPFSWSAVFIWLGWLAFQMVLAQYMPDFLHKILPYRGGKIKGGVTPGGNQLTYNINGLQAWLVSHVLFIYATFMMGLFSPTIIFDSWGSLLWIVNITGYALAVFAYIKAHRSPTCMKDVKKTGDFFYDFFMGMELNPRIKNFDLKLFFNGRPGIIAWTLINISFAAHQYYTYGMVTNSMILVNFFHLLYVVYFFWEEAWYLNTIDIHHDHFGWMLAWGDCVWLPYMYTLQGFYLAYNPVQLSTGYFYSVLAIGLIGYFIFHSANRQKEKFRNSNGQAKVWGKQPEYIKVSYIAKDGHLRESKLLTSGWWGLARHFNYTGDLILSLAYSLACGFHHILPYFYFFYLLTLLVHRCLRDEERLSKKYGEGWNEYKKTVPYRLIPGIF